jgi:hypothetical protein
MHCEDDQDNALDCSSIEATTLKCGAPACSGHQDDVQDAIVINEGQGLGAE